MFVASLCCLSFFYSARLIVFNIFLIAFSVFVLSHPNSTVCLGSTNVFSIFIFMPDLACYRKVWIGAFYCPKTSL